LPPEWSVDPVKVALLLRCADAAHLDQRRAPRFLFTLTNPKGISNLHWKFQTKLAKPQLTEGKLLYTSSSPFSVEDADAWQLCYDALSMVDRELAESDELLHERQSGRLEANGVLAIRSPESLSKYVKVDGWRPLDSDLHVSDVPRLAKTLGGKDLYSFPFAPLRELLQNAADAIEARSAVEEGFSLADGLIRVRVKQIATDATLLEIEDNGVGMSERVLASALLDFGTSFWQTERARSEFPGLQSSFHNPRGRYGIGFFSVFMWATQVGVATRKYSDGLDAARVLEFRGGVDHRPIIRIASTSERSTSWTTRVSMKIDKQVVETIFSDRHSEEGWDFRRRFRLPIRKRSGRVSDWPGSVRLVAGALPIKIIVESDGTAKEVGLPDWLTAPKESFSQFLAELAGGLDKDAARYSRATGEVKIEGKVCGRAFIMPAVRSERDIPHVWVYDRGIFVGYHDTREIFGIMEGRAANAARERIDGPLPTESQEWLAQQSSEIFSVAADLGEVIACQKALMGCSTFSKAHPMFIYQRQILSFAQLAELIVHEKAVTLRLKQESESSFEWAAADSLSVIVGTEVLSNRIYTLVKFPGEVDEHETFGQAFWEQGGSFAEFLTSIRDVFGGEAKVAAKLYEQEGYHSNYVIVTVSRVNA
jgi:hypothetical protein